jgi:uncharacterized protein
MSNSPKLKEMTVWVTSECDLHCKYCFVYKLNENSPKGKMTKQTADQLIEFAKQDLDPNGTIWFFGAEPLCNFEIIRYIVEKSKQNGAKWKFGATTNATLITEEMAQWMKENQFGVLCSIDGLKDCHNTNRIYPDGSGSWNDAWRGLALVRKYLNPNPQIRWTITPSTTKGIADAIKTFVEDYKLTNLAIDMVYEVDWAPSDLAVLKSELEKFRDYYEKWTKEGISVFSMWVRDANAAITKSERLWCTRCGLGEGSIGVDYDGTFYPCHRFIDSHKIKIGDIYNGFTINRVSWMQSWRNVAPYCEKPIKCLNCNYKMNCSGGCIAMNYDIFGTCHVNAEATCTIKQLITKVLGDLCRSLQNNPTFQKQYQINRPFHDQVQPKTLESTMVKHNSDNQ